MYVREGAVVGGSPAPPRVEAGWKREETLTERYWSPPVVWDLPLSLSPESLEDLRAFFP